MSRFWFVMGAALMLTGVALEAFGSHTLREALEPQRWSTFQTGARNHIYHALALFAVSYASERWGGTGECIRRAVSSS